MSDIPAASRRVVAAAAEHGVAIDVHVYPDGTKTSADAAAAVGCELSQIAKSLVFEVDDEVVVAILPGDRRLDTSKLATVAGGNRARRASLEHARAATGYAPGGTPAFAYDTEVRVFADESLKRHELVWSAAGTPTTVYPIALTDLIRLSGAEWADLAEG